MNEEKGVKDNTMRVGTVPKRKDSPPVNEGRSTAGGARRPRPTLENPTAEWELIGFVPGR